MISGLSRLFYTRFLAEGRNQIFQIFLSFGRKDTFVDLMRKENITLFLIFATEIFSEMQLMCNWRVIFWMTTDKKLLKCRPVHQIDS